MSFMAARREQTGQQFKRGSIWPGGDEPGWEANREAAIRDFTETTRMRRLSDKSNHQQS